MLPCPNNSNGILGNDETLLNYHPNHLFSQYFLLQESFIIDHDDNKQTVAGMEKNDGRHSKIFTANGPRDRRVRLSKDIARKFFDLQDLLGFDRPSKTLDWLLTKSKPAIKELIKPIISSHLYSSSPSSAAASSSECEILEMKNNNNMKKKKKKKRKSRPVDDGIIIMAKEMRAKARERARERTKKKLFLRELMNNYGHSFSSCLQAPNNLILSTENWDFSSASSTCFHPLTNIITTSSSSPSPGN